MPAPQVPSQSDPEEIEMKRAGTNPKLLIYAEYFLPVIGGVQTALALLARGLAERAIADPSSDQSMEVTLVTRSAGRWHGRLRSAVSNHSPPKFPAADPPDPRSRRNPYRRPMLRAAGARLAARQTSRRGASRLSGCMSQRIVIHGPATIPCARDTSWQAATPSASLAIPAPWVGSEAVFVSFS